jgi:hypothetical protein
MPLQVLRDASHQIGQAETLRPDRHPQPPPPTADPGRRVLRTGPDPLPHRSSDRRGRRAKQPGRGQPAPGQIPAGHRLPAAGTRRVPRNRPPARPDHHTSHPGRGPARRRPARRRPRRPGGSAPGWPPKPATPTSRPASTATWPKATTAPARTGKPAATGSRHSPCTPSSAHPRQTRSGAGSMPRRRRHSSGRHPRGESSR